MNLFRDQLDRYGELDTLVPSAADPAIVVEWGTDNRSFTGDRNGCAERVAIGGVKSFASSVMPGIASRNGAMLSSTQKPRPCEPATSSFSSTMMSMMGRSGRPGFSGCQLSPSLYEMYTPRFVPA